MIPLILLITLITPAEIDCLVEAVYYEARGEPLKGQKRVVEVIINRYLHYRYPNNICEVISQPYQFSYKNNNYSTISVNSPAYLKTYKVVIDVIYNNKGGYIDTSNGAIYYHNKFITPNWDFNKLTYIETVNNHVFYRDK